MTANEPSAIGRLAQRAGRSARYRLGRLGMGLAGLSHRIARHTLRQIPGAFDNELLYAVYDLKVMPTSYDIAWFLAAAEVERRDRGLAAIHVVISLFDRPFQHTKPAGHEDHVDEADMLWRVENIIVPCCNLLPSCTSYSLMPSPLATARLLSQVRHVWPEQWQSPSRRPTLTQIYNHAISGLNRLKIGGPLRAPAQGRSYVGDWIEKNAGRRALVVMTLRNHHGGPARNSDMASWLAFADWLDRTRFLPVFVPDTLQALSANAADYHGHALFPAAAHNMGLRLALYEAAYLNLSVSNGPAYLSVLDEASRYLMFKILVPGLQLTSAEHLAAQGFPKDTTPAFATAFQKWVWEDDLTSTLQREFEAMSVKIDAAQNAGGPL